jgi:hypothetical protein
MVLVAPEAKRSMRCTTKARCLFSLSCATSRDNADGHGIVFVKHGKLPGETRPAPVFVGRNPIRLSPTAASLARKFLHWLGA